MKGEGKISIGSGVYTDSGCELFDLCCGCPLTRCADEWRLSPRARRALEDMAFLLRPLIPLHPDLTKYIRAILRLKAYYGLIYPKRHKEVGAYACGVR